MSLELVAYGDDPEPVEIAALVARCRMRGYECRVIRDDEASESSRAVAEGPLLSEDAVVAWRLDAAGARAAEQVTAEADWKLIGKLEDRGVIGTCAVEMSDKPEEYNDENDLRELEQMYPAGYAVTRRRSRVCWYIRLQAGRHRLSAELAESVLRTLLELRGGTFDDPQACTFEYVPRGGVSHNHRAKPAANRRDNFFDGAPWPVRLFFAIVFLGPFIPLYLTLFAPEEQLPTWQKWLAVAVFTPMGLIGEWLIITARRPKD